MVQEVTTTSWGKRIINALWGIIIGIILIGVAVFGVFWNEGNSLHTSQSLEQAQRVLIAVPSSPIDSKNDNHVIYVTGLATTQDRLTDELFGVTENAIQLDRKVEMYQWQENSETKTEKNLGGSEQQVTTYTYKQIWSNDLIDSSNFKEQAGHQNPSVMPIHSKTQYAKNVTVGDFTLPDSLITEITGSQSVDLSKVNLEALQSKYNKSVKMQEDGLYFGDDSSMPKIGDMRISITFVAPTNVSIIAEQTGNSLQPYMAPAGKSVSLIEMGIVSSEMMIHNAVTQNSIMTWIIRLATLVMMIIGFSLIMAPLVVLADVVPFVGSLVGFGTGLIAFILGLILWVACFALAWITVRPFLAIGMIVVAAALCAFLYVRKRKTIK